jgi:hypothetical protein
MTNVGIWETVNTVLLLLEEQGETYGTDADFLRYISLFIHIDLVELNGAVRLCVRELLKDGGDDSTRATPRSPKIYDNDFARIDL